MPGRLARHALWNFLGLASPMLMAVAAIPPLIRGLGVERFGVLTLAWTLIGYLSLFDLGLGRALTKLVADGSGTPGTVRTALALLGGLGAAGGLLMAAIANRLTGWLHIPEALQAETVTALYLVAAAIPLVTLTAGWRGVLEARRRFGALGLLRAAMGVLMFGLPLAALRFSPKLPGMLLALWLARAASLAAHAWLGRAEMPAVGEAVVCWKSAGPLLRFGGWITVSNLLSPLMVSLDRFLIAALLSVAAVAFYATPYELVTRLQLLPASVAGALFPALSEWLGRDAVEARRLYRRALAWVFLLLGPAALLAMGLARPALDFWLGAEFAARSTGVVRILAAGVWINALAYLPSAWLQAAGRPDLTAKLHLLELPLYLAAAWWLIETRGIEGAAWAWTLRVTLDAGLLFWLAGRGRTEPHATGWEIADAAGTRVSF